MLSLTRLPLFAYGFRPFFLAVGVFAVLAVPAWLLLLLAGIPALGPAPAYLWHAHEMLYGFAGAAVAGFLLTAVPGWTASRGFAGLPLLALAGLWLAGRLAFALAGFLPLPVVAAVELAFLPGLALLVGPSILRERDRNRVMLAILAALWLADAVFLLALQQDGLELAGRALLAALNVLLLLVTVIGGRIVPAFTASALRQAGQEPALRTRAWVERLLLPAMAGVIVLDAWRPGTVVAGGLAGGLALLHGIRLAGWQGYRVTGQPIAWVLHLGYLWLPVGFALKAVALLAGPAWAGATVAGFWQHAFGIGALATMVLAVSTRAALGHTGRQLVVSPVIALAYGCVTLAALARVALPAAWPGSYAGALVVAAASWTAAFVIFLAVYAPILLAPRVDGRPG